MTTASYATLYQNFTQMIYKSMSNEHSFHRIIDRKANSIDYNDITPEKRYEILMNYAGRYYAEIETLVHTTALELVKTAIESERNDNISSLNSMNELNRTNAGVFETCISTMSKTNKPLSPERLTAANLNHLAVSNSILETCTVMLKRGSENRKTKPAIYRTSSDWNHRAYIKAISNNRPI